MTLIFLL